jgi:hypothetical protein
MQTFVKLEDALAILRLPKGVQKQTPMYRRGLRVYVPHGGGYIEVRGATATTQETSTGAFGTAHPDVQLLDFEFGAADKWTTETDMGQKCLRMRK